MAKKDKAAYADMGMREVGGEIIKAVEEVGCSGCYGEKPKQNAEATADKAQAIGDVKRNLEVKVFNDIEASTELRKLAMDCAETMMNTIMDGPKGWGKTPNALREVAKHLAKTAAKEHGATRQLAAPQAVAVTVAPQAASVAAVPQPTAVAAAPQATSAAATPQAVAVTVAPQAVSVAAAPRAASAVAAGAVGLEMMAPKPAVEPVPWSMPWSRPKAPPPAPPLVQIVLNKPEATTRVGVTLTTKAAGALPVIGAIGGPDTLAAKSGQLKVGQVLHAINDVKIASHEHGVALLKSTVGPLKLSVSTPETESPPASPPTQALPPLASDAAAKAEAAKQTKAETAAAKEATVAAKAEKPAADNAAGSPAAGRIGLSKSGNAAKAARDEAAAINASIAQVGSSSRSSGQYGSMELESAPVPLMITVTFEKGPLGVTLGNRDGVVKVVSVDARTVAEAKGVVAESVVREVSGKSTEGLDKAGVIALVKAASRPLTIKFGRALAGTSEVEMAEAPLAEAPAGLFSGLLAAAGINQPDRI